MKRVTPALLAVVAFLLTLPALADTPLPIAKPEEIGLSAKQLGRITEVIRADIDKGRIPGAVMLIARDGKIGYFETLGAQDKQASTPMQKDAIFRIYSMTKPIVSVAAMMLAEEGRLHINEPVSKYLPQLKDLKVGVEKKDAATGNTTLELVATQREMTIQDLLRHTSGLTYGVFGKSLVKQLYTDNRVDANDHTNAELIEKLAKVPLMFQPGTTWEYSRSTDVLGHVVEVVSGQTLDRFLDERILKPLKMHDTGFWVPSEKAARIAEPFKEDPDTKQPIRLLDITKPPKYLSGGGGMVSTAADYVRFAQMLLNGGELDGVRILSRKSIEYMTADHTPEAMRKGPAYLPGPGYGFGLGFAVRTDNGVAATPGSAGDYNWGGLGGTYFWVDPKEKLIAIWMMQAPGQRTHYRQIFRSLVYPALSG